MDSANGDCIKPTQELLNRIQDRPLSQLRVQRRAAGGGGDLSPSARYALQWSARCDYARLAL